MINFRHFRHYKFNNNPRILYTFYRNAALWASINNPTTSPKKLAPPGKRPMQDPSPTPAPAYQSTRTASARMTPTEIQTSRLRSTSSSIPTVPLCSPRTDSWIPRSLWPSWSQMKGSGPLWRCMWKGLRSM